MSDLEASVLTDQLLTSPAPGETPLCKDFTVRFWGVRGSIPTPGAETVRYGGNTACVELMINGQRLVFDGGTGLRALGKHLLHTQAQANAHIFFTHVHWDRIQGFPFFTPAFVPGNFLEIYGAPAPNGASIKQCLTDQMLRPNFFTPMQKMSAEIVFHNIAAGEIIELGDGIKVETVTLNSRTSSLGFRMTFGGYSLVYATDTDSLTEEINQNLLYLAHGADLLIYDGIHSDTAYYDLNGAANIPWEHSIAMAKQAQVKEIALFHHSPAHDDDYLERVEMEIRARFPQICFAREGMVVELARVQG